MPESLASNAVNKCLHIKSSDVVTILLNEHFIPLAEDIAIECLRNGADVLLNLYGALRDRVLWRALCEFYEALIVFCRTEGLDFPVNDNALKLGGVGCG